MLPPYLLFILSFGVVVVVVVDVVVVVGYHKRRSKIIVLLSSIYIVPVYASQPGPYGRSPCLSQSLFPWQQTMDK